MSKTATAEGKNVFGEERKYTFQLMDAETGTQVFHEYDFGSLMMAAAEVIGLTSEVNKKKGTDEIDGLGTLTVVQIFTAQLAWTDALKLSEMLLKGAIVEGKPGGVSEHGVLIFSLGDPSEQYLAMSHALMANFPKYSPFFEPAADDFDQLEEETDADKK